MTEFEFPHGKGWGYPVIERLGDRLRLSVHVPVGLADRFVECPITETEADILKHSARRYWLVSARAASELCHGAPNTPGALTGRLRFILDNVLASERDVVEQLAALDRQTRHLATRLTPDFTSVFPELTPPAVVFDLDGTLIDSLPNVTDAANSLLAGEGLPPLTQDVVEGFVGMGEQVFMDRLIAATDLDGADRPRLMRTFIDAYNVAAEDTRLFPAVAEALDLLRRAGHRLAICTNKPAEPLAHTLAAAGLDGLFDIVVAGDTLPVRKPDPAPLRHIMDFLQVNTCIYVGDSAVDMDTAEATGVPFVLYTEGIRTTPLDQMRFAARFDDFWQLPGIVAKLVAQND